MEFLTLCPFCNETCQMPFSFVLLFRLWRYMDSWLENLGTVLHPLPLPLDYQMVHPTTRDPVMSRRGVAMTTWRNRKHLLRGQQASGRSKVLKTCIWSGLRRQRTESRVVLPRRTSQQPRHQLGHVTSFESEMRCCGSNFTAVKSATHTQFPP